MSASFRARNCKKTDESANMQDSFREEYLTKKHETDLAKKLGKIGVGFAKVLSNRMKFHYENYSGTGWCNLWPALIL